MFGLFKPKSKIDVIRSEAVSFLTKNLGLSKATAKAPVFFSNVMPAGRPEPVKIHQNHMRVVQKRPG